MRKKYYRKRDGSFYTKLTKEQIKNKINPFIESSFLFFLKEMDYPYFSELWLKALKTCIERNHIESCLSCYIARMQLCSFKGYHWIDSDFLNTLENKKYMFQNVEQYFLGKEN